MYQAQESVFLSLRRNLLILQSVFEIQDSLITSFNPREAGLRACPPHATFWRGGGSATIRTWEARRLYNLASCCNNHSATLPKYLAEEEGLEPPRPEGHICFQDRCTTIMRFLQRECARSRNYYSSRPSEKFFKNSLQYNPQFRQN